MTDRLRSASQTPVADVQQRTVRLSPVKLAVVGACAEQVEQTFAPITPAIWWRAGPPFAGSRETFAAHLRALERNGILARRRGIGAIYDFTLTGVRFCARRPI